jgi:CubicO group peptidase (beta-lactamase class C family)
MFAISQAGRCFGLSIVVLVVLAGRLSVEAVAKDRSGTLVGRVDAVVRRLGIQENGPGLAVLVIERGRAVVKKGYGLADLKARTPITAGTTFELASASKPFASMAVMMLAERGKIGFSDEVRKYVPELPERDRRHPVRLVHLLQHTSGLPEYTTMKAPEGPAGGTIGNSDYAREIATHPGRFKPAFTPGGRFEYSNTNYLLLALVVERVTGRSYGTFLREAVFAPLGMDRAWVYESPEAAANRPGRDVAPAVGYSRRPNGTYEPTWGAPPARRERMLTTGDGAVWCSLDDLARWDEGLRQGRLVKPATWRQALTPSTTSDGTTNEYGFGWSLERNGGRLTGFFHNGSWSGFETTFSHSIADDRAIVLLANRADVDIDRFWKAIVRVLDQEPAPEPPGCDLGGWQRHVVRELHFVGHGKLPGQG